MDDNAISVSLVIHAPIERVWALLVEEQQEQQHIEEVQTKDLQIDPPGPSVAGQVIHTKAGPLRITVRIKHIEEGEPPGVGQTISASVTAFGKEGEALGSWHCDPEHYLIQSREEIKHPWYQSTTRTNKHCFALDETSCVIVYVHQSETATRLIPRRLIAWFGKDKSAKEVTKKAYEDYLKGIKEKAERDIKK